MNSKYSQNLDTTTISFVLSFKYTASDFHQDCLPIINHSLQYFNNYLTSYLEKMKP